MAKLIRVFTVKAPSLDDIYVDSLVLRYLQSKAALKRKLITGNDLLCESKRLSEIAVEFNRRNLKIYCDPAAMKRRKVLENSKSNREPELVYKNRSKKFSEGYTSTNLVNGEAAVGTVLGAGPGPGPSTTSIGTLTVGDQLALWNGPTFDSEIRSQGYRSWRSGNTMSRGSNRSGSNQGPPGPPGGSGGTFELVDLKSNQSPFSENQSAAPTIWSNGTWSADGASLSEIVPPGGLSQAQYQQILDAGGNCVSFAHCGPRYNQSGAGPNETGSFASGGTGIPSIQNPNQNQGPGPLVATLQAEALNNLSRANRAELSGQTAVTPSAAFRGYYAQNPLVSSGPPGPGQAQADNASYAGTLPPNLHRGFNFSKLKSAAHNTRLNTLGPGPNNPGCGSSSYPPSSLNASSNEGRSVISGNTNNRSDCTSVAESSFSLASMAESMASGTSNGTVNTSLGQNFNGNGSFSESDLVSMSEDVAGIMEVKRREEKSVAVFPTRADIIQGRGGLGLSHIGAAQPSSTMDSLPTEGNIDEWERSQLQLQSGGGNQMIVSNFQGGGLKFNSYNFQNRVLLVLI